MEKYIIWFLPDNKKIQLKQFHTEASSMKDAIQNLADNAQFTYKVMGVSAYHEREEGKINFVNNKFF